MTLGRDARRSCARTALAYVGDQIVAEGDLLLGAEGRRSQIDPRAIVHPGAEIGEGHDRRAVCHHRPARAHRRRLPDRRVGVIDGWTEIGDDNEIFPFASIGLMPQDLKYQGEPTRAGHRQQQHLPRVRHHPPRHAGGGGRDADRRPQPVHGLRARRARLPRRQLHDLRQRRDARRPRDGRGLRDDQRVLGRAPVLPRRASTPSSAATRSSRRTRCRSRRRSATARASTA